MTLRERAFWLRDSITGGRVRSELHDIELLMNNKDGGARRAQMLQAHLKFVGNYVPFYGEQKGKDTLADFPVISKKIIRDNFEATQATDIDLTRTREAVTSGSTGAPFRLHHDARKRRRSDAEVIYWGKMAGYNFGAPLYHLKVWSERNSLGRINKILRNLTPIDVAKLSADDLWDLVERWRHHRNGVCVIANSSKLDSLARELIRRTEPHGAANWEPPKVQSMIGQSEHFSDESRAVLEAVLHCSPVSRYGLVELGIVGQQVPQAGSHFRLNLASMFVEILKEESDEPAAAGELGRIVITDFINRAQPLIRYDTGDLGSFALIDGKPDRSRLGRLEGRKLDQVYDTNDRPLAPLFMSHIWWRYPSILDYQLVQLAKGVYELRLNAPESSIPINEVVRHLEEYLGSDAQIDLVFTNDRFIHASGKRKSVVSTYEPE